MKKKILSLLLLFLYLIPSIGVSWSVHYCGDQVAAIVIVPTSGHPCPCGPSEPMEDGCCSDEAFSFKIKDNHKNTDVKVLSDVLGDFVVSNSYTHYLRSSIDFYPREEYCIQEVEPPDIKLFKVFESYII